MTTLYKKVGRRYKPVAEHEEWDSYPAGAHPSGPHPMHAQCGWFSAKTQGAMA